MPMPFPIEKAVSKYQNEGLRPLLRSIAHYMRWRIREKTVHRVRFLCWRAGLLEFDDLYSESYYTGMGRPGAQTDAESTYTILDDLVGPNRVIDLGCGVGRFLKPFHEAGVDVYGIDAAQKAIDHAVIPETCIDQHNLMEPFYPPEGGADLVLCLEVLEHLPQGAAETAVASIARSAPVALVSIAQPGQFGHHHVNMKPFSYWIGKFQAAGMVFDEAATAEFRERIDPVELNWLGSNSAIFRRD